MDGKSVTIGENIVNQCFLVDICIELAKKFIWLFWQDVIESPNEHFG